MIAEVKSLHVYGQSLVGKFAQSTLLTMLSDCGQRAVMEPAQKITAYSIQHVCGEPQLMVTIDGNEVFEDTLRSIK